MKRKLLTVITTMFVIFSMLAVASPALALTTRQAKGTIVAINKRTRVVTIRNLAGTKIALRYTANTKLTIRGRAVSLARMHVGDRIVMSYSPTTRGAIKGTALSGADTPGVFELEGLVSAVDTAAGTVDIASEHGGSIVQLKVDANTVITRDHVSATLADLVFGDKIHAKYDSTTMLASSLKAESDVDHDESEGVVTAIDTATGDITFTPEGGGSDVTIHTDSATVFMFHDSPGTLADLQVGDPIEAKYDTTSLLASFVEIEDD